jgi:uncharacterized peroxidase-related enzyme
MSTSPMSELFTLPAIDTLPKDIRARLDDTQSKSGFLPNIFVALAKRPDEFRAFFNYHDVLMDQQNSSLTKAEKELIVVATSALNDCHYCVIAHGAILRIRAKNPLIADQVAINFRKAELTSRERDLLDFAVQIATEPGRVGDEAIRLMQSRGFSEDDIWDVMAVTAFFAMSNRLANTAGVKPNPEFYTLGRQAKESRG